MEYNKRLIEVAFPLKQTSLESVHEKMCHAGHPKSLHIWPARRPLAACRAALIATLLPDPQDANERRKVLEKLGGKTVQKVKRKKTDVGWVEELGEETAGGILRWGQEKGPDLDWFRERIREAYGGRAPKVLDPFSGGGAIPLEAMRLGCEATAIDVNPVAWFVLRCTLEFPQKFSGLTRPLPDFVLSNKLFLEGYLKSQGFKGKSLTTELDKLGLGKSNDLLLPGFQTAPLDVNAGLAWHVRAWSEWIYLRAFEETHSLYSSRGNKPIIAYLWARTIECKNCRATVPLLKSRWIAKKDARRVLLVIKTKPDGKGLGFDIEKDVPYVGENSAQRKAHDKKIGAGTMSRSGVTCPHCKSIITSEDIRLEGQAGRIGKVLTVLVSPGENGKEFNPPREEDFDCEQVSRAKADAVFDKLPFGVFNEPIPEGSSRSTGGSAFTVFIYGYKKWKEMYSSRQLAVLGSFATAIRDSTDAMRQSGYSEDWIEAITSYLICILDKVADYNSAFVAWQPGGSKGSNTFQRWALPIKWDYVENNILESDSGGWRAVTDWVTDPIEKTLEFASRGAEKPTVLQQSAIQQLDGQFDLVITDPPYYDAIPYSDLMDFFYLWIRRAIYGLNNICDQSFAEPLCPKWDSEKRDGELIDDSSRNGGDAIKSKQAYEDGMASVFQNCHKSLTPDGRLVIVFAHKDPDAWETLVSAIIKSGFIVDGSWPIQTEMGNRTRSQSSAALSSSVWLVCKKRNPATRPGWDNKVLEEMHANITARLRDFWDAGIRGPDFVWAATGPAMEAYSQYPVVKKANEPGAVMTVSEFLTHVRRMVVDFVVGRVLTGEGEEEVTGLDNATTYYLLHRHDFGMNDAPAGPCILYAVSCGLSDKDLADRYDLLARRGGKEQEEEDEADAEDGEVEEEGSGSSFRLKAWNQRKSPRMGYDPATDSSAEKLPLFPDMAREVQPNREIPLIDQVHRLMHLWKGGDVTKVNEYLDLRGLRRNPLFHQLLQALIELAPAGSEERSLLESISNHVGGKLVNTPSLFA